MAKYSRLIMLFNSYIFIFLFLPITLLVYFALGKFKLIKLAKFWLLATSLFFYGYWNPPYLILMLVSIAFNYSMGQAIAYLDSSTIIGLIATRIIILGIVVSMGLNLSWDYRYLASKYSRERLIATSDIISVFQELSPASTICEPKYQGNRAQINPYNYIDLYITKKNFNFVNSCNSKNYLIKSKYRMVQSIDNMWPLFTIETNSIDGKSMRLISKNNALYLYQQQ